MISLALVDTSFACLVGNLSGRPDVATPPETQRGLGIRLEFERWQTRSKKTGDGRYRREVSEERATHPQEGTCLIL